MKSDKFIGIVPGIDMGIVMDSIGAVCHQAGVHEAKAKDADLGLSFEKGIVIDTIIEDDAAADAVSDLESAPSKGKVVFILVKAEFAAEIVELDVFVKALVIAIYERIRLCSI